MDIKEEILKLALPEHGYVVVGSGILAALGIRESNDIDMIVSQEVFDSLDKAGWEHDNWIDQAVLKKGPFDVGTHWMGDTVEVLIDKAVTIDGISYLSLNDLLRWKKERARQKDMVDIELINKYLASQSA